MTRRPPRETSRPPANYVIPAQVIRPAAPALDRAPTQEAPVTAPAKTLILTLDRGHPTVTKIEIRPTRLRRDTDPAGFDPALACASIVYQIAAALCTWLHVVPRVEWYADRYTTPDGRQLLSGYRIVLESMPGYRFDAWIDNMPGHLGRDIVECCELRDERVRTQVRR